VISVNPPARSLRTITVVPLLGEAEDLGAARWLREIANPAARQASRVAVMPLSGIRFFEATGEAARQLDLIWAQTVPADTTPVVVTLHHPALPAYLDGLDAAFVIGMAGGDHTGLYAGRPNVTVVGSDDPGDVLLAAVRTWNDPQDPAFLLPPEPAGRAAAPAFEPRPPESPDPDADFFDEIFREDAVLPEARDQPPQVVPEPWGSLPRTADPMHPLPPRENAPVSPPEPALPAVRVADDPLAALAALKPVPVERAAPEPAGAGRRSHLPPDPPDTIEDPGSRGFLERVRLALGRRRAIQVPGEIGDLLLGTRPAPLVVVGSRKGGVGKTAISAGLAQVAGYSLDGRAGIAALVDQNINNADQWGRLRLPEGVTTVREVMARLEQGDEFPAAPAYARTPALAVFPESRDPGDGYPPVLIERFAKNLRSRYVFTVVDLPNALPAFTSAEAAVAASYLVQADLVLVPTTDDPNALRGVVEYLATPSMRQKAAVVPYIVSTERGIRDHPKVLELLDQIRERAVAVVPFPRTEKATLAVVQGASVLDVDTRLRNAYIDLASTVARVLVRGI
jgi:cellulose biosynthesis protein BcsQ